MSNEAFMLSNVFSPYKDVVHVMSTKCKQITYIVKCIIIGLEEIDF